MGRIPVFLYNDLPWIPYQNTSISVETYGFSAGWTSAENTLLEMLYKLKNMTTIEYNNKIEILKNIRFYFTYPGVIKQLEMFFHDPFGSNGGNLRCTVHPKEERCCG
jgi:hypothetical protein